MQGITIAFNEFQGRHENEVPVAAEIARSYGIRHHVRIITQQEFDADLPRILSAMDQPSIDGINTWYASKAVAELGLKVVISGVGGDELFYGYPSFHQLPNLVSRWKRLACIPGARPAVGEESALEVTVSEPKEVAWWALHWGAGAEVLEPPELRQYVAETVRAMARIYREEGK